MTDNEKAFRRFVNSYDGQAIRIATYLATCYHTLGACADIFNYGALSPADHLEAELEDSLFLMADL